MIASKYRRAQLVFAGRPRGGRRLGL